MISKIIGEYPAAILLLLVGLVLLFLGFTNDSSIGLKIGATMLGVILTLVNGLKLVWLSFFDGKEDSAKLTASNPYTKKYEAVNVDRWITPLALIGLALATGLTFMAFTWEEKQEATFDLGELIIPDDIEIEPPPTEQKPPPPPPPPAPPPPPKLEIGEDEVVVEDEPVIEEVVVEEEEIIEIPEVEEVVEEIVEEIIEEEVVEVVEEEPEIFEIVEEMPTFPGGDQELLKYLYGNIKYPPIAKENDIQGLAVLSFVVNEDGAISDIKVLRDIGGGCGDEAARVVGTMPKWVPGKQRGKAVKVAYKLPVRFKLE